jgi:hypothetical protein
LSCTATVTLKLPVALGVQEANPVVLMVMLPGLVGTE